MESQFLLMAVFSWGLALLLVVLAIVITISIKRAAEAHKIMAEAQQEIAKQLANISAGLSQENS